MDGGRGAPPADAPAPRTAAAAGRGAPAGPPPLGKRTPEGGRFWDPEKQWSCSEPPWGELVAVNANTGDIAWHVPLGIFEELEAKGIKTGTPSSGGPITTAGNLVFIGATIDGYFRAFDARNGKELWSDKLPAPAHYDADAPTWAATASSTSSSARTAAATSAVPRQTR